MITVNTLSTAPTSISGTSTICNGNSTTLTAVGGTDGTGASYEWFTGSCGGTSAGAGISITVSPTTNTTYYVRRTGTCNTTTCASQLITVNTLSTAPTSISGTSTICNGSSTTLTAVGGTDGTGATYEWFTGSCGGTAAGTGISITVSPTTNTTYYVRRTGTCNTTTCASQLITVNTLSTAPTSISGTSTICNGSSTTLTAVGGTDGTGASYEWFTGSCGGTAAGTGISITVSPTTNTTYYVRRTGTCNTTTCASQLITVNTLSTAPTSISGTSTICNGNSTTLTAVGGTDGTGASYEWFTGSCGGTSAGAGISITVSPTANTTYYVRRTGTCNTTTCASQLITANANLPVSVSIVESENPICAGITESFTATPVNGGTAPTFQWKLNGSNVGTGTSSYVNSSLANGNTITCVLTSDLSCTTGNPATSNSITITVNAPPTSSLMNGDYVWSGNVSTDWETAANWLVYDGTNYATATTIPDNTKNVFLRAYIPCASNFASTIASSAVSCRNITIETGLSLGNISQLNVYGNWTNNGNFNAGTGLVVFNGASNQTILSGGDAFYDIGFNNSSVGNTNIILSDNLSITNSANFVDGIVIPNTNKIIFESSATSNSGNPDSFVDGPIERIGSTAFVYPSGDVQNRNLGDGMLTYAIWAPISLTLASSVTTDVEYRYTNSGLPDWWEHGNNMDATLHHVSDREYWFISTGADVIDADLYWADNAHADGIQCHHGMCTDNIPANYVGSDLTIAVWNGSMWQDHGVDNANSDFSSHNGGHLNMRFDISAAKANHIITFGSRNNENPLPVDLLSFDAKCDVSSALISWETASETNNAYFIVEKSKDAREFFEIARVNGAGNSNESLSYSINDNNLYGGDNYYRLKQIDYDGKITTYIIVRVNCDKLSISDPNVIVYPNPFTNEINIVFENFDKEVVIVELFDDLGRIILTKEISTTQQPYHTIIDLKELKPAVYNLRTKSDTYLFNNKIIKR